MGDRAGLLRLLRDLRAEQQPGKAADLEAAIVGLFDEIREELNNEVDQANTLALETVRSTKEAAELRINQLRERHDMETKPLYAEIERLRSIESKSYAAAVVAQSEIERLQAEVAVRTKVNAGNVQAYTELQDEAERLRKWGESATVLVAKMHEAAVGRVSGPIRGVVEDVQDLRNRMERSEVAIRAVLDNPYGCPFCDCGKLRKPDDPRKGHDDDCPWVLLTRAIENSTREG